MSEQVQVKQETTTDEFVDIFCDGDGTWSCYPWSLYRIPTDKFDYSMMLGNLETKEDLSQLVYEARNEVENGQRKAYDEDKNKWTEIWAAPNGIWSGNPSINLQIPTPIFDYLLIQDSQKLGWLSSKDDVKEMVSKIEREMLEEKATKNIDKQACYLCGKIRILSMCSVEGKKCIDNVCKSCIQYINDSTINYRVRTEIKQCGHICTISSLKQGCCSCLDQRSVHVDINSYPLYVDGHGWMDNASRGNSYCPFCKY
jgi:hypothetical protein